MYVAGCQRSPFLDMPESVAFSICFENMDSVGKAVEQSAGETLVTKYLGPVLEREIRSDKDSLTLIGAV